MSRVQQPITATAVFLFSFLPWLHFPAPPPPHTQLGFAC
jgi:hypothetical protein